MNERIRELKEEALVWAVETLDPDELNEYEWAVAIDKKFAELIVKECLDCIAKVHKTEYTKEFNEGYTLGVERCFYKIEDHFFGVEE